MIGTYQVNEKTRKEKKLPGRKKKIAVGGLALVVSLAVLAASWLILREGEARPGKLSGNQVMDKVNYRNQNVAMTPVEANVSGGALEVSLDAVKEKKLVFFIYGKKGNQIPLMAYITPAGKLVTAVSMCEPCRSTKFHIEGNQMVCNACGTRWELESLEGISGGCLKYPPDVLAHSLQGNKIIIKETDIQRWKPRA